MINYQVVRRIFFLGLFLAIGLFSCETSAVKEQGVEAGTVKEKKKRDPREVDMVKRMTHFISKRVDITPQQREEIKSIVQEYRVDSMSLEEFYYARLEMKDRILENVLTPEQKADFESK